MKVPLSDVQYQPVTKRQPDETPAMPTVPVADVQYQPVSRAQTADTPEMPVVPITNMEYATMNVSNIGPINQFKGVSTLDPFNLEPGYATSMKNLTASGGTYPALKVRDGFTEQDPDPAVTEDFFSLGLYLNSELHTISSTGNWYRFNDATQSWIRVGTTGTADSSLTWSFTNFKGNFSQSNLIAVSDFGQMKKFNGTTISNLLGTPAGVTFKFMDQHTERLYASDGQSIYYSAIGKAEDWTTIGESGAGQIAVETNSGESIEAIKAGLKHLMVFKRNTFLELWGTRPGNYQLQRVSETGALGPNAVTVRDQTAYWINDGGIFQYNGGLPRKDFSLPVIGYFKNMQTMDSIPRHLASAVSTKESVLFSIPQNDEPSVTLEYHPDVGIWSVWRRNNVSDNFAPMKWVHWKDRLAFTQGVPGRGFFVYLQTPSSATGVAWEWVSPPFGGGPFSNTHQWYKLWYVIDVPATSTLVVSVSTKAEGNATADWIEVQNIPASPGDPLRAESSSRRVIVPIEQVANKNWLRVKFAGTGQVKFHEFNIQQREMPLR